MKNVKFLIFTASIVALLSCSTNYAPSIEDDSTLESQTRGESSQNDSTDGGVSATKTDWVVVSDSVEAYEVPKDEAKNDSIPNDSIPNDSIQKNRLTLR